MEQRPVLIDKRIGAAERDCERETATTERASGRPPTVGVRIARQRTAAPERAAPGREMTLAATHPPVEHRSASVLYIEMAPHANESRTREARKRGISVTKKGMSESAIHTVV